MVAVLLPLAAGIAGRELAGLAREVVTGRAEGEAKGAGRRHARACRAMVVVAAATGPVVDMCWDEGPKGQQ